MAGNLSKIVGTPMSPNKRIFLNIVATYGRSLFALVRVNGVWSDPIDEERGVS